MTVSDSCDVSYDSATTLDLVDEFEFAPTSVARQHQFRDILVNTMPRLGNDESKIILAEILIALKLEGVIANTMSERDKKLVKILHEAILAAPDKKRKALRLANRLLRA